MNIKKNYSHRFSTFLISTRRHVSVTQDEVISYQYMLKGGYLHQESSGLYSLLPLGYKVLENIIHIVQDELYKIACIQMSMPILQPAYLWEISGRFDAYGLEMLKIQDRHKKNLIYSPTNEEMITNLLKNSLTSYREFPKFLYQIQWKFRDEIRPRFGLMRGREFLMKDAYSFDLNKDSAILTYAKTLKAYMNIFRRMNLKPIPLKAATGPIGGNLSHEIAILAEKGETTLYANQKSIEHIKSLDNLTPLEYLNYWNEQFAVTEDVFSKEDFIKIPESQRIQAKAIEVGQLFYFGTKYSKTMNLSIMDKNGQPLYPHMGSYGIGLTRLLASIIEVSHDQQGIIWPKSVSPFDMILIPMSQDTQINDYAEQIYHILIDLGFSVLWDDRNYKRAGEKLFDAELIGIPYQIRIGKQDFNNKTYTLHYRSSVYDQFHKTQNEILSIESFKSFSS